MAEAEQQQGNQKVVVALIFGLVIGAFLMWMFNGQPNSNTATETADTDTEEQTTETESTTGTTDTEDNASATVSVSKPTVTAGAGSVTVANQKAGSKVALGAIKYPSAAGWLAVHALENGAMGGVLGASRYNTENGLAPTSIDLLAPMVAGAEYMVVFHEDNKDGKYSSAGDKVMMGADGKPLSSTFKAE